MFVINRFGRGALASLAFVGSALMFSPVASATTATATLSAGTLGFINSTPGNLNVSGTLSGVDQTLSTTQPFDVSDATGSGTGWDITATSTTFTSGSHTLSTAATSITSPPSVACDTGSTCTAATNSVPYPYALPAAATAPTATKFVNATANTGMGNELITPTWKFAIPASTYAGTYTSTWTLSLVSGP